LLYSLFKNFNFIFYKNVKKYQNLNLFIYLYNIMDTYEKILFIMLILSFTFTPLLRKQILKEFTDEEFYIIYNIALIVFIIIYAVYLLKTNKCSLDFFKKKVTPKYAVICSFSAFFALMGSVILTILLKRNDATFIIPQVQPVVILLTMVFGFLLAKENVTMNKIIGAAFIILGLIIINNSKGKDNINK